MKIEKPSDWDKISDGTNDRADAPEVVTKACPDSNVPTPPPTRAICKILSVTQTQSKQGKPKLLIQLDIADGTYKGFFNQDYQDQLSQNRQFPKWKLYHHQSIAFNDQYKGQYIKRYFKRFVDAVAKSNRGFKFDWNDSNCLVGKFIGAVINIRQWRDPLGNLRESFQIGQVCSVYDIKNGKSDEPVIIDPNGQPRLPSKSDELQPADPWLDEDVDIPFD